MEFLPCGDLGKHIKNALAEEDTRLIAQQLLEGLKTLHNFGFLHRDLKPEVSRPSIKERDLHP